MVITVTGTIGRDRVTVTHDGTDLAGDPVAILRARAAVLAGVEVGFAGGLGAGTAELNLQAAPPARIAATMAYGLDTVDRVEGVAEEPLGPDVIP